MKTGQKIRALLLAGMMSMNMCLFSVSAATGTISLSVEQALPGYKVTVVGAEDTDTVVWKQSAAAEGTYEEITGAAGKTWAITNACAEKYIKAVIGDVESEPILVGAALPIKTKDGDAVALADASAYAFTFNEKTYQMLDHYESALKNEDSFYILYNSCVTWHKFSTSSTTERMFRTDDTTNIGYWLNNTWATHTKPLDAKMVSKLVTNHTWLTEKTTGNGDDYTFEAGVALPSYNEVMTQYTNKIGLNYSESDNKADHFTLRTALTTSDRIWYIQHSNGAYTTKWGPTANDSQNFRIRPSFYLDKSFFIENKITEMGSGVKDMLKDAISYEEMFMGGQYTDEELAAMGYTVQPEVSGDITISAVDNYPGYKVSVSGIASSNIPLWYISDTQDGEYTKIAGAAGNNWAITNACAGKYIKANVAGKLSTNAILVGLALPERTTGTHNGYQTGIAAATSYAFTFDGKTYQMLDHYENEVKNEDSFYILWNGTNVVQKKFDNRGNTYVTFDPTNENNVGYWLNNTWTGLNSAMKSKLVTDHVWRTEKTTTNGDDYTFEAGVGLLSLYEVLDLYTARIGTDYTAHEQYEILRSAAANVGNRIWTIKSNYTTYWADGNVNCRIRPSFYLDKSFFIKNKITNIGADVAGMLKNAISYEEMAAGEQYTKQELAAMGYDVPADPTIPEFGTNYEISALDNLPGYKVTVSGITDDIVTWYQSTTETGIYELIEDATGNNWAITNACANKYIRACVNNELSKNAILVGAALGAKGYGKAEDGIPKFTDAAQYRFEWNGKTYQMLDYYNKGVEQSFYIIPNFKVTDGRFSTQTGTETAVTFNPNDVTNIGYWLNTELLDEATPSNSATDYPTIRGWGTTGLDEKIRANIIKNHVWHTEAIENGYDDYTFEAAISLPSYTEVKTKYHDRFGTDFNDGVFVLRTSRVNNSGFNRMWGVSSNATTDYIENSFTVDNNQGRIRPAFYLNKAFFINNRVDPTRMGSKVKEMIVENIPYEDMSLLGIYEEDDLYLIGYQEATPSEPEIEGDITISAVENYPGFEVKVSNITNRHTVKWYQSETIDGEYSLIEGANGNNWAITNACAGKYIQARVMDKVSNSILVGDALGNMSDKNNYTLNFDADSAAAYTFEWAGKSYQMLEHYENTQKDEDSFYIFSNYRQAQINFSKEAKGTIDPVVFDPSVKEDIGYWLNNELLLKDAPNVDKDEYTGLIGNDAGALDSTIREYIVKNHLWRTEAPTGIAPYDNDYTFEAGITLPSFTEILTHEEKIIPPASNNERILLRTAFPMDNDADRKWFRILGITYSTDKWQTSARQPDGAERAWTAFHLDKNFFINNKIELSDMGAEVMAMLAENITADEMLAGGNYSIAELVAMGYTFNDPEGPTAANLKITAKELKPGYKATFAYDFVPGTTGATEEGTSFTVSVSDTENGEYTTLETVGTKVWNIPNSVGGKYIKVTIIPKDSNGKYTYDDSYISAPVKIAPALGFQGDKANTVLTTATADTWKFFYAGTETQNAYQLVDAEVGADGKMNFLVVGHNKAVYKGFSSDGSMKFEPNENNNVAHWLNNEYAYKTSHNVNNETDKVVDGYNFLTDPQVLNIDMQRKLVEHTWLTEAPTADGNDYTTDAMVAILSVTEFLKYQDRIGYKSIQKSYLRTAVSATSLAAVNPSDKTEVTWILNPYGPMGNRSMNPAFYLEEDFFIDNFDELIDMGEDARKLIIKNIPKAKMLSAGISNENLKEFGYPGSNAKADNVVIAGTPAVGQRVVARYLFNNTGDSTLAENAAGTTYAWYIVDSNGIETSVQSGANHAYVIQENDLGKTIKVVVTPKDTAGETCISGEAVSAVVGTELARTVRFIGYENGVATFDAFDEEMSDITLIFAVYDKTTGALVGSNTVTDMVNEGMEVSAPEDVVLTGKRIKLMAWESLNSMLPLCVDEIIDN